MIFTFRKSKVSALTVSFGRTFPPGASPFTAPRAPAVSWVVSEAVEGAAGASSTFFASTTGAGAGAGAAGASSIFFSSTTGVGSGAGAAGASSTFFTSTTGVGAGASADFFRKKISDR